jgi:8-oxo-dGTP pyrophosphatase MutT (NUDIX family)
MTQNKSYTLKDMIEESMEVDVVWNEPEWGFPKGRRNYFEKDIDCAVREFTEETGYSKKCLQNINNIQQFEEIFIGSNYKSYKHKYYVMKIEDIHFLEKKQYDKNEVSKLEWKTFEEALKCIRDYNLEKKKLIRDIYNCLNAYKST